MFLEIPLIKEPTELSILGKLHFGPEMALGYFLYPPIPLIAEPLKSRGSAISINIIKCTILTYIIKPKNARFGELPIVSLESKFWPNLIWRLENLAFRFFLSNLICNLMIHLNGDILSNIRLPICLRDFT